MNDDDEPVIEQQPAEQLTVDAANPVAIKRQRHRKKSEQRESDDFWVGIFSTELGRREMWNLLTACHAFEERFACGPNGFPQVEATWFHAGEQAFGQRLYQTWLVRDPHAIALMHVENDTRFASRPKKQDD